MIFAQKFCVDIAAAPLKSATLISMIVTPFAMAQPVDVDDGAWHGSVGMALMSQPKYPGSNETRMGPMPTFNFTKGRWQLGALPGAGVPLGASYTLQQEGPWRFGVGVGTSFDKPRTANNGSQQSNLGEIRQSTLGSLTGSYTEGAVTASASIIGDIGGNQQGTRVLLDVMLKSKPMNKWVFSAGPGITVMDRQYAQTYYGVSSAQSASSGYATYQASAGINVLRIGAGADYELTRDWRLGAKFNVSKLQGDAASSPIAEKGSQISYGFFANYRF
jgi:outer membrane protein